MAEEKKKPKFSIKKKEVSQIIDISVEKLGDKANLSMCVGTCSPSPGNLSKANSQEQKQKMQKVEEPKKIEQSQPIVIPAEPEKISSPLRSMQSPSPFKQTADQKNKDEPGGQIDWNNSIYESTIKRDGKIEQPKYEPIIMNNVPKANRDVAPPPPPPPPPPSPMQHNTYQSQAHFCGEPLQQYQPPQTQVKMNVFSVPPPKNQAQISILMRNESVIVGAPPSPIPLSTDNKCVFASHILGQETGSSRPLQQSPQPTTSNIQISNPPPPINQDDTKFNPKWFQRQFSWQYDSFPLEIKMTLHYLYNRYASRPIFLCQPTQTDKISISNVKPLQDFIDQFDNPQIKKRLQDKKKEFPHYRQIRGDGNCFYRAFIGGYLEMALTQHSPVYFLRLLFEFAKQKNLVDSDCTLIEYQELRPDERKHFLIHRLLQLFTYRMEVSQKENCTKLVTSFLYRCFQQIPYQFDIYIVIAIKNYTASVLNLAPQLLQSSNIKNSIGEIRKWGLECSNNEICINALAKSLETNVTLFDHQKNRIDERQYAPENNMDGPEICLFFRRGHYDLIYRKKNDSYSYN